MLYTITFTGTNSFIKGMKGAKIKKYDSDGMIISESAYKQPFLPNSERRYTTKRTPKKILIDMGQSELNKLVKEADLYDSEGKSITTAPINNPGASFWNHSEMTPFIKSGETQLDDEIPVEKILLAAFAADPTVRFASDAENSALNAKIQLTVSKVGSDISEVSRKMDEVEIAMQLLFAMDFQKQVKVLRAMGVDTKNPAPEVVKRTLMLKITDDKDRMGKDGERNIEKFTRLATMGQDELNLKSVISSAFKRGIIQKRSKKYIYGEIPLGRTQEDILKFLEDKDNSDLKEDIMKELFRSSEI